MTYVQNAQGQLLDDIEAQSELGWGARNVTGPMTRQQLRSMAALMLAQGLPASSPGPSLKTLYQMKGDPNMPHTVPGFSPVVGHYPPLYPREGGVYLYRPNVSGVGRDSPTQQHLRMMHQRHTPRGFRPFHRKIHIDIDFDANVSMSGMGDGAPAITITGDFDPMDPIMGSFLSNIARSVTKSVSSVVKTVAKPAITVAKAVVKPSLKIALAPIKTAVNVVTKPKATLQAVTRAVRNPVGTLKSIPGAVVRQVTAVPKAAISTAVSTVKSLPKTVVQAAKETLQAANSLRQNGIVKAGVAGLAVAIPPVGIPAMAALALTQKVVDNAKSLNPVVSAAAKAVIVGTAQQAKTGDSDAKRAIALMAAHGKSAAQSPKTKEFHFRVTDQGRIQRIA